MSAPSTAITRLDLSFAYGEFDLLANLAKFIGLRVLPVVGVAQEAADFAKVKIASYLSKVEETKRAPKANYSRDYYEWTKDSYALEEHGVEEVVDDATVERYGDVVRAEQICTMRAINRILQRLEFDIAAAVFNTTTWTGAALTTAVATPWTTKATADPVADIDAAHDKVSAGCGEDANTLVLSKKAFRAMVRTDRVEGLLKFDASGLLLATQDGQNLNAVPEAASGLKQLLQVENILVGRGFKNTADKGLAASLSRMWDETMCMLAVIRDDGLDGDLENPMPQVGRTIFSTKNDEPLPASDDAGLGSLIFDEYREEQVRGSVLRPRNKRQVKILHPQCGHLLQGVTA
ncbi:MAG: major capsid protein [Planctomycetaceae bacterium]|nr:major capsid protein [Planctomycetaceae bacterium]